MEAPPPGPAAGAAAAALAAGGTRGAERGPRVLRGSVPRGRQRLRNGGARRVPPPTPRCDIRTFPRLFLFPSLFLIPVAPARLSLRGRTGLRDPHPGSPFRFLIPVPHPGSPFRFLIPVPYPGPASQSRIPVPPPGSPSWFLIPVPHPNPGSRFLLPVPHPSSPSRSCIPVPHPNPGSRFPIPVPHPGFPSRFPIPIPDPGSPSRFPIPVPHPWSRARGRSGLFPPPLHRNKSFAEWIRSGKARPGLPGVICGSCGCFPVQEHSGAAGIARLEPDEIGALTAAPVQVGIKTHPGFPGSRRRIWWELPEKLRPFPPPSFSPRSPAPFWGRNLRVLLLSQSPSPEFFIATRALKLGLSGSRFPSLLSFAAFVRPDNPRGSPVAIVVVVLTMGASRT
ncbi:tetra-peptide repeat homeobox protein 1-like [Molothrus aeneus]|uniref:tetra-peptide repeat homeobox protein 1-like n=1 Tax=Molothrus aeneus TaxID=84833 RepID=UPI00345AD695